MGRRFGPIAVSTLAAWFVVGAASGAPARPAAVPKCPIVAATGDLGINTSTAGGIARTTGAYGALTVACTFIADSVQIQMPGHAFKTATQYLPGGCTLKADTITCKLDTYQQQLGLSAVGGWQDSFKWVFSPKDETSHNVKYGSCGVPVTVTVLKGPSASYRKTTKAVCDFALGDVLR
jgi:hypothetical protein